MLLSIGIMSTCSGYSECEGNMCSSLRSAEGCSDRTLMGDKEGMPLYPRISNKPQPVLESVMQVGTKHPEKTS